MKDMCDLLADSYASNSSDNNFSQEFLAYENNTNNPSLQPELLHNHDPINNPITIEEYRHVLSLTDNTSPGPDDILYDLIKYLPVEGTQYIIELYNFI